MNHRRIRKRQCARKHRRILYLTSRPVLSHKTSKTRVDVYRYIHVDVDVYVDVFIIAKIASILVCWDLTNGDFRFIFILDYKTTKKALQPIRG